MQYMLMYFEPAAEFAKRVDPAEAPAYWGAWNAYLGTMNQAGIVVSGNGLQPPQMSTTVRPARWQAASAGRPVCRHEGTPGRLLHR